MSRPTDAESRGGEDRTPAPEGSTDLARRKLLRAAVYVAPLVISTLTVETAFAQRPVSCGPSGCTPCTRPNPCKPCR